MVVSRSSAKQPTPTEKIQQDLEKVDPGKVDPTKDPKRAAQVLRELEAIESQAQNLKKKLTGEFDQTHGKLIKATADLDKKEKVQGWLSAFVVNVSVGSGQKFSFLEKALGKHGKLYTETIRGAQDVQALDKTLTEIQTRKAFIKDTLANLPLDLDALGDGGKPPSDRTLKKLEDEAKNDYGVVTGDRGEIIHAERIPKAISALTATDAKLKKVWEQALARVKTNKDALDKAELEFRTAYPGGAEQREYTRAHAQGRAVPKKATALLSKVDTLELKLYEVLQKEEPLVKQLQGLRELVALRIKGTKEIGGPSHQERLADEIARQFAGTAQGAIQEKAGLNRLNTVNPFSQAATNPVDPKKIMDPYFDGVPGTKPQ